MAQIENSQKGNDVFIGAVMVVVAALSVLTMGHHPTGAHASGGVGDYVHGAMIILMTLLFLGFAYFSLRRGLQRPLVIAALTVYGVSLAANIGAATISGFVVPALAARGGVDHDIFLLCREANQALAKLGVVATGAAFAFWSLDMIGGKGGMFEKLIGVAGLVAGLVPTAAIMSGQFEMGLHEAFAVYATHAAWSILVGIILFRVRLDRA